MSNLTTDLQDCYRTLEIKPGASQDEVDRAYQNLTKKLDPNRFANDKPRRAKMEKKLEKLNDAYAQLSAELRNDSAPATAAPTHRPEGYHWTQSWKYLWIFGVAFAMTFLLIDSKYKLNGIDSTTKMSVVNLPAPARDLKSPTGYPYNQHVLVMPALGTDGYHWIMQTEKMVDGEEGWRVRHTDYDGPPDGREVHWSSSLHWLLAVLAWFDHLVTGSPYIVSLERTAPWANTFVLGLMILIVPAVVARRFGSIPATLIALTFVVVYPYYEFSFVGYFDHHGLAASADLLMALLLAGGGAGWLRNAAVNPENLSTVDRALWKWLPDRAQAKRWMIASGIATGTGLWVSSASIVPALVGMGLGAILCTGWLARKNSDKDVGVADPTLWRVWGKAAAAASIFYYLLEYAPSHFTMRLEVNHPLYALALFGAGDILCRLSEALQATGTAKSFSAGTSKFTHSLFENGQRLAISAGCVLLLPLVVIVGGESVFVIRPGFLLNLHNDYILEFRTFFEQMGYLTPLQIAGGISLIPLSVLPIFLILWTPELQKPWKAVLAIVFMPAAFVMSLAMMQIRWLGIDCGIWCAALSTAALVTTAPGSAYRWDLGARRLCSFILLLLIIVPFPSFTALQWGSNNFVPGLSELDLTQIVTRDVSQRLRMRLGSERGVIVSGPTTTTWMMYFGGFKGIGSLYWENLLGLKTTAAIYSATTNDEAKRLIDANHVTHIAIFQWDAFAEEYARLGAGMRKPKDDKEHQAQYERLSQAFILKILHDKILPPWLLPIPYHLPDHPMLRGSYVMLLEVVPEMSEEEYSLRIGQWYLNSGAPDALKNAQGQFEAIANKYPDYYANIINLAEVYQVEKETDLYNKYFQKALGMLDQANTLALQDRVELSILLFTSAQKEKAEQQVLAALTAANEKELRKLIPERLATFLQIAAGITGPGTTSLPNFDLAVSLLPTTLSAPVLTQRAAVLYTTGNKAKAVELLRTAIKGSPDFGPALITLGRILAISSDATLRNGVEALDLAAKAAKADHGQSAENLELFALASATAGRFDDAVFYARQAATLYDNTNRSAQADLLRQKIVMFQAHQAYFEP